MPNARFYLPLKPFPQHKRQETTVSRMKMILIIALLMVTTGCIHRHATAKMPQLQANDMNRSADEESCPCEADTCPDLQWCPRHVEAPSGSAPSNLYASRTVQTWRLRKGDDYVCAVHVLEDNRGLFVQTFATVAGDNLEETGFILASGHGLDKVMYTAYVSSPSGPSLELRAPPYPNGKDATMFGNYCGQAARKLPPEVRVKFLGEFGVR